MENNKKSDLSFKIIMSMFLIAVVYVIYLFTGNPIKRVTLQKQTDEFIKTNYPDIYDEVTENVNSGTIRYMSHFSNNNLALTDGIWNVFYFSSEDSYLHFTITYDKKGDMIYNGYEQGYLKGETVYDSNSSNYREFMYTFLNENDKLADFKDLYSSFGGTEAYFEELGNEFFEEYNGPYFDPTKEHKMEDLANEYGIIQIGFKYTKENSAEDFCEKRNIIKKSLTEENVPFAKITILYPLEKEILNFDGIYRMSKEEFLNNDIEKLVEENYSKYFGD